MHVRKKRNYYGEFDAEPLIAWLNARQRPAGDPVEVLIALSREDPDPRDVVLGRRGVEQRAQKFLGTLVRKTKLAVAPILADVTPRRWYVEWRATGNMDPQQALAVVQLLHLAGAGLLESVRHCACGKWFFARFQNQRFHTKRCQQAVFRSDPEWQEYRRQYMQRRRREQKLREQRWTKRKGKR